MIGWNHPTDESDQWDGFNEPGIEHFRSNPLQNLAREIIQNSNDAGDGSKKIYVRFKLLEVETSSIPNLDELITNLKHCLIAAESEGDKAKLFFKNAIDKLSKNKIKVLEASDFNTQGMKGPSKNGTPFYAFVKAKGQSKKGLETASGSYGIGKLAPYATSEIRTVFVSTVYQDTDGSYKQLSQGKAILMSHDIAGDRKEGTGFWGVAHKCQPVEGISGLPEWILRASKEDEYSSLKGTKITILCFDDVSNWEDYLAVSIAENFFAAISAGKLSVEIDDKHKLDIDTIRDFFENIELKKIVEDSKSKGEPEQFDNSYAYYEALQESPEVIVEHKEHTHLGNCELRIIVGEGLPKKVCALRNSMFISDSVSRLKQFPDYKEFVAVFQCKSEKGNKFLRLMEPPKHDDFEPNLLPTKEEQDRGKKSLSTIATWIRDMLKKHARDPVSDVTSIDELKDYFGDENGDGTGSGTQEKNPLGKLIFRAKPTKPSPNPPQSPVSTGEGVTGGEDGGEGGGGSQGGGGGGSRGGKGASTGGSGGGSEQKKSVEIANVRAIISGPNKRRLFFTPAITGSISISILEAGADSDYSTKIIGTDIGELKNGSVIINCISGERYNLNVDLIENFSGAIKVVANEI